MGEKAGNNGIATWPEIAREGSRIFAAVAAVAGTRALVVHGIEAGINQVREARIEFEQEDDGIWHDRLRAAGDYLIDAASRITAKTREKVTPDRG